MSDDKTRGAPQGVKFSQFKEVGPDPANKLQVVGLKGNENVRADLTTDLVSTNSTVVFRDAKGRYKSIDDLPELNNQLEVNRFLLDELERLNPESRTPIFAEDEPTEYPHAEEDESTDLEAGDQWYQVTDPGFDYDNPDPEGLDLFAWTDVDGTFEWVLVEPPVEYVKKKGGDEMEGPLVMQAQEGESGRATNKVQTLGVYSNSDGSALRLGTTRDRVYIGHNDTEFNGPIKVDEIQEKNLGGGIQLTDRVILKTEGVEDDEVVTKKYIDDKNDYLQNEIIELEEEIEALAPTMERGSWRFNPVGSANTAMFAMYAAGTTTSEYPQADQVFINTIDSDGTLHNFSDVEPGNYLEIFSPDDGDYGLYKVISKSDETGGANAFWMFDIEHSRSNRPMADAHLDAKCRIKFFSIADSVDATSFVIKAGDTMSGKLQLDKPRGNNENGSGFTVKGAIGADYSSAAVSEQEGDLLQAYHNAGSADAINYKGKIIAPKNIVTKEYVDASATVVLIGDSCKWRKGGLDESTLEGYQYFGIEKAGTTSSQVGYGNVLYLNKLIAIDGTLQPLKNYTPTDGSLIEVWSGNELWFKGLLDPTTYKVAGRNPDEIVCDFTTNYPVVAKPSFNWSTSTTYKIILTGMVKK